MPGRAELNSQAGMHLLIGFNGTRLDEELKSIIRGFHIGGLVLFKRNIEAEEQLLELLRETQAFALEALGRPLWIAIDQEGGPVQRLIPPFTRLPSAHDLAERGGQAVIEWTSRAALDLQKCGIQINFAPVLDVLSGEESHFMRERCLGSDPEQVAALGKLWIASLQENGVSATAKHFPGLGLARSDPHHFSPVIRWESPEEMESSLLPFREAIRAGVHGVMTSHACYPALDSAWPATLSPAINRDWLRDRLHFEGVLFSDDLDMAAVCGKYSWEVMVRQGLLATVDFFLQCQAPENTEPLYAAIHDALGGEKALWDLHRKSLRRIERLYQLHRIEGQPC